MHFFSGVQLRGEERNAKSVEEFDKDYRVAGFPLQVLCSIEGKFGCDRLHAL